MVGPERGRCSTKTECMLVDSLAVVTLAGRASSGVEVGATDVSVRVVPIGDTRDAKAESCLPRRAQLASLGGRI